VHASRYAYFAAMNEPLYSFKPVIQGAEAFFAAVRDKEDRMNAYLGSGVTSSLLRYNVRNCPGYWTFHP
jgi:hypothetical protein